MIIELDTKLLDIPEDLNMNQVVFLSMVLDKNQKLYQAVHKLVSLISDDDISCLIQKDLITSIERGKFTVYEPTQKLKDYLNIKDSYFDVFFERYPIYVLRPDGTKAYLRTNVNKCRNLFNITCGGSKAMAEHLINCLDFEVSKKMKEGKISYMKTMWRWLVDHQWEESEEAMCDESIQNVESYGTELI